MSKFIESIKQGISNDAQTHPVDAKVMKLVRAIDNQIVIIKAKIDDPEERLKEYLFNKENFTSAEFVVNEYIDVLRDEEHYQLAIQRLEDLKKKLTE